jgi:hypothetical protein
LSSQSLGISLGLAAVDGLLCAFVAILVLALVLIGSGTSVSAPDLIASHVLLFDINSVDQSRKSIDLRLLVDVGIQGAPDRSKPSVSSNGRMVVLSGLEQHLQHGSILWKDCQTLDQGRCSAALFVTRPKIGERWRIRIRLADADNSFTTSSIPSYKIKATLGGRSRGNLELTPDNPIEICADWEKKEIDSPCQ